MGFWLKKVRIRFDRIWSIVFGFVGGFLLYLSLAPVLISGRNSGVISQWRDIILQWTEFTGYLRIIFVAVALIVTCVGLLGAVVNLLKPYTGQKMMLWGGAASIILMISLWLGLLDLHVPLFGSTDVGNYLIWDSGWGVASWSVGRQIFRLFGGGWLVPALAGGICLVLTNLPRWWIRLR